jgi:superfamily II DNA or RNA helicase
MESDIVKVIGDPISEKSRNDANSIDPSTEQRHLLKPKAHQTEAIQKAVQYYKTEQQGKLIMPCGSGKTLTALWIADAIRAKRIIIVLPTLQLQSQALKSWLSSISSDEVPHDILLIGSDKEIGSSNGILPTTDPLIILNSLNRNNQDPIVVFTTYHSSHLLISVAVENEISFDFCIFDEAHHTAGIDKKVFHALLKNKGFNVGKKLFMTATTRILQAKGIYEDMELVSMDDEKIYGREVYRLDTREAILKGIICDYKIVTMYSDNKSVHKLLVDQGVIADIQRKLPTGETKMIGIAISIIRSYQQIGLRHVIAFTSTIVRNKEFAKILSLISSSMSFSIDVFEINNSHSEIERNRILESYNKSDRAIIVNSRLLGEGFDMPAVDGVVFVDEKSSVTDIVQAAGRCWRTAPGKRYGYILLPIVLHQDSSTPTSSETLILRRVVSALMTTDDLVLDYFKKTKYEKGGKSIESIFESVNMPGHFDGDLLVESIKPTIWRSANLLALKTTAWAPAEETARFTLSLDQYGITTNSHWVRYCNDPSLFIGAPLRPLNIPINLPYFYKEEYKHNKFFSNGRQKSNLASAKEAAKFTRSLAVFKIDNSVKWLEYCKDRRNFPGSPAKPDNIPIYLWDYYKEEYKASKFFAGARRKYKWVSVEVAKAFINSLSKFGITYTRHWIRYWRDNKLYPNAPKCPKGLPLNLSLVYKDQYKVEDFFPGARVKIEWASIEVAIHFTRSLAEFGVFNTRQWSRYCADNRNFPGSPAKPLNIPSALAAVYKDGYSAELFFTKERKFSSAMYVNR